MYESPFLTKNKSSNQKMQNLQNEIAYKEYRGDCVLAN